MSPSQTPRMHWSDRQRRRQEQRQQQTQQQPAPQLPLERAAADDIIDVLEACDSHAQQAQANCPFSCCIGPNQPQTISHLFITCPVATTVTDWLCRLWQAITGYLPVVSVANLLAADTPSEHLPSDALLQTWHRICWRILSVD